MLDRLECSGHLDRAAAANAVMARELADQQRDGLYPLTFPGAGGGENYL